MKLLQSRRALNVAIALVAVVVIGLGAYLGYTIYQQNEASKQMSPLGRATQDLVAKVKKKPNDIDLRMQLAQALTVQGRNAEAAQQYQQVLKLRENFPAALSGLGFIAARDKQWTKSESYWRKVIEIASKGPNANQDKGLETAYFYLGSVLYEQARYEDAIGALKEALRMNQTASDSHFLLAMTFKKLDEQAGYRDELQSALYLDPNMPEANYEMGQILLKEKDVPGAAEHFRRSVDSAPAKTEPREALDALGPATERIDAAKALLAKDPAKARDEARIAVAVDPKNVDGWIILGDAYVKLKKPAAATKAYNEALAVEPGNAEATARLKQVASGRS
jgi:cytochrome c-type biogenesis protein CcmH/NrfG